MLKQNLLKDKELKKFQSQFKSKQMKNQKLMNCMVIIIQDEGMNVEALQTKYPIIGWEVHSDDTMQFWKIIKVVHHVSTEKGQDIFILVEKDFPLTKGLATLMLSNKLRVDQQSEMADELLTKIYNIANRPRN
ncbi:hypothetical protein Tco_0145111 [Tanacetum coccineum]